MEGDGPERVEQGFFKIVIRNIKTVKKLFLNKQAYAKMISFGLWSNQSGTSFFFIQVFTTIRCSELEFPFIPPICIRGQFFVMNGFIRSETSASKNFASQSLPCMYLVIFRSNLFPLPNDMFTLMCSW